jgi:hypothetical protein
MVGRDGSVVLGLILARYWIHSNLADEEDCGLILEWVDRLLRGDGDEDFDDNGGGMIGMDAVTGYWLLVFLCSLCPELENRSSLSLHRNKTPIFIPIVGELYGSQQRYILSIERVFDRVKMLTIVRLGLLSFEAAIDNTAGGISAERVLGYSVLPCFFGKETKATKGRVFCVASLVEKVSRTHGFSNNGDGLTEWFRFVRSLVDVHFEIARAMTGAKWKPDGWLLASIELFDFGSEGADIELSSNNHGFVMNGMQDAIDPQVDHLDLDGKNIDSLIQCPHAYAIAIAVNQAVLKNAYAHYRTHGRLQRGKKQP